MATSSSTNTDIPSVMKAAQQSRYGEVRDVVTLSDNVPVPRELSSKQILVRVIAAASNPLDWKLINGNLSLANRQKFPHTPGSDVSGVVVDVGSGVTRFKTGDEVFGNVGFAGGAFAEYVRENESLFTIKPKNLSWEEAAAVPMTCETSYQAIFEKASPPVGPGTKILICGGSSTTGFYAIQMAKAVGAYVATTCSQRNFSLLEKLGYTLTQTKAEVNNNDPKQLYVIDYNVKDFGQELEGDNYDVVYDCVGGPEQWTSAQRVLKRGGQFITLIGDEKKLVLSLKSIASLSASLANRKFWSIFGSGRHNYVMHFLKQAPENLDDIQKNYIETGKVKPLIDTVYNLQKDGVEALYSMFDKSQSGKAQGKLVLKIANE